LINALIEQGVDSIFGYPGASVLSVYDALSKSSIRHILTAHEQGACFAADGYARASGKCGVVLTTSGPGATNLVTGIADAFMDSVPLVAITGNVTLQNLGHDSFQEVDIFDVTMPITKYSMIVKSAADIAPAIRKAFNIALSGRRGPVLVDIPSNVFDEKAVYVKKPAEKICGYASLNSTEIDNAIALINKSKRPLIYAGGGVKASKATAELFDFALKICAPVMVSYMGIGCFNPDDPSYVGVLSNINTKAHQALRECDLLITLGARFNSRYTAFDTVKKRKIPLLQIDVDKAEIDKNLLTTASVNADIKTALTEITPEVNACVNEDWAFCDFPDFEESNRGIDIITALNRKISKDTIVLTDVGLHQVWTAHHFKIYSPECFLTSGGLGAMGFSLGAAIGAHTATGKKCLVITGDGSFNMNFNELSTAVKHHIPLVVVIINNNSLGMIRKLQLERGNKNAPASSLYLGIDYVKLAEAMGARGVKLSETDDIEKTLDIALSGSLPVVIDCNMSINTGI
ncbi:MAG: thiamine pyrophosphate-binding protein, partial [Clostridia bacterium]